MKILPKKELVTLKQKEQEQLVRTGAKIATDVDKLREMKVIEEENLKKFRETALSEIQAEINRKAQETTALDSQIATRKKELERLFAPLDEQFARYVRDTRHSFEEESARLLEKAADLDLKDRENRIIKEELTLKAHAQQQQRVEIAQLREAAEQKHEKAEKVLEDAQLHADYLLEQSRVELGKAQKIRSESVSLMNEVRIEQSRLEAKEKELEKRELAVIIQELKYYSPVRSMAPANK